MPRRVRGGKDSSAGLAGYQGPEVSGQAADYAVL